MRWERRIRQNVSPICSTRWLSKPRELQVLQQGLHHLPVLARVLPHPHENFELRVFHEALAEIGHGGGNLGFRGRSRRERSRRSLRCSCAFDNCGLLSADISPPSYSMTTIHSMSIHYVMTLVKHNLGLDVYTFKSDKMPARRGERIGKRRPAEWRPYASPRLAGLQGAGKTVHANADCAQRADRNFCGGPSQRTAKWSRDAARVLDVLFLLTKPRTIGW